MQVTADKAKDDDATDEETLTSLTKVGQRHILVFFFLNLISIHVHE